MANTLGSDLFLYAVHSAFVSRFSKSVELLIQQPVAGADSIDNVEAGDFCVFIWRILISLFYSLVLPLSPTCTRRPNAHLYS